jgi:AcrR family transcriptional regulator
LTVFLQIATNGSVRVRRTNEERSAETRARLLDATVECLIELGYARTTTTVVADRSGVSRGAQLHHFPTKEELVLAACEHLFMRRLQEFRAAFAKLSPDVDRAAFAKLSPDVDRAAGAIDLLWKMIGGEPFYAWLELAVAGRTDATLGRRVRALGSRTDAEVERTFRELFPEPTSPNPFFDIAPKFTFALLQGLAIDRLLVTQPRVRDDDVVHAMKMLSAFAFPGGPP